MNGVAEESKPFGVRLTRQQRDALQAIAEREYNTPSNLIRRAVDEFLKRHKEMSEQPELFDGSAPGLGTDDEFQIAASMQPAKNGK